jgi:hypothetical protein
MPNALLRGSDEGQKKRESNPIPTISQFTAAHDDADLVRREILVPQQGSPTTTCDGISFPMDDYWHAKYAIDQWATQVHLIPPQTGICMSWGMLPFISAITQNSTC